MAHALMKTGAALLVLGGFAAAGPAQAVSPLPLNDAASLVIPVQDQGPEATPRGSSG